MTLDKNDLMKLWGGKCRDLSSQFTKIDEEEIELSLQDKINNIINL